MGCCFSVPDTDKSNTYHVQFRAMNWTYKSLLKTRLEIHLTYQAFLWANVIVATPCSAESGETCIVYTRKW